MKPLLIALGLVAFVGSLASAPVLVGTSPEPFVLRLENAGAVKKVWGDVRSFNEPRTAWGRDESHAAHRRGPSVGAESNAIFDVGPFVAPAAPLRVNLDAARGELAMTQQAYVMVEVLDEQGATIASFDKERCLLVDVNELGRELRWDNLETSQLAGRRIIVRFHLRDARLFALHTVPPPAEQALAQVAMEWGTDRLAPWDVTEIALRGSDAAGRSLNLDAARIEFVTEPADTPLHLRSDPRDRQLAQASVPGAVARPGPVIVRARVTLRGETRESAPRTVNLGAEPPPRMPAGARQLFMRSKDVTDPAGPVEFQANTLGYLAEVQGLPTTPLAMTVYNREIGGRYHVWGSSREAGGLFRAETDDGVRFDHVQPLQAAIPPNNLMTMVYNQREDRYLAFERIHQPLGWRAYFSADGTTFKPASEYAYHDHDATNLLRDDAAGRYLAMAVTYQQLPEPRRYPDNISRHEKTMGIGLRRVLSVRESRDGVQWSPGNNVLGSKPDTWLDRRFLIEPDAGDPPDLEHYWFNGFKYGDRWVGIVLTYAPSPELVLERYPYDPYPSKHGPHLGTEWWISDDGVKWERPYRNTSATPDLRIYFNHAPLVRNNRLLFLTSNQIYNLPQPSGTPRRNGAAPGKPMEVYSLPVDRIASAGSVAPASFASQSFAMPAGGLFLNYEHRGGLAVELLDAQGRVLPGYGRADGTLPAGSALAAPVRWSGRTGAELAGRPVRLRFYTENARVYALYHD